jgi:hypothetical protein
MAKLSRGRENLQSYVYSNGDVWLSCCDVSSGGVYYFDRIDWVWYQKKHGVGDQCVHTVAVGSDGIIWAATKKVLSYLSCNNI